MKSSSGPLHLAIRLEGAEESSAEKSWGSEHIGSWPEVAEPHRRKFHGRPLMTGSLKAKLCGRPPVSRDRPSHFVADGDPEGRRAWWPTDSHPAYR